MSHTTIIHIVPGESIEYGEELSNSSGGAAYVWNAIGNKYISAFSWSNQSSFDRLWELWKNKTIPVHQRAVLMFTFDRAYVKKINYARMARHIRAFLADFPNTDGWVCYWEEIASILEGAESPAIGLYCTSVSDNPFHGRWNEEKEEYDPIDWARCYELYEVLEQAENERQDNASNR
jgi:hypothetical protein